MAHSAHTYPELLGYLRPKAVQTISGSVVNAEALRTGLRNFNPSPDEVCTLTSTDEHHATVLLDYGVVVCGIPVFFIQFVDPAEGSTEVVLQATYSEALAYIHRSDGDGPFPFTAGADTLRINKHRIDGPGMIEHFQLQGGQRWQKLELITPGTVRVTLVGFKPTTQNQDPKQMAGYFECSDPQLNKIWLTGAQTIQVNCLPARSTVPNWQVLPTGTYISSQRVSHYIWGGNWVDYTTQVEANILEGGFAMAVRSRQGFGPLFQFYLTGSELKIDFLYGFYNQTQISLWPTPCDSWKGDASTLGLAPGTWNKWEITAFDDDEYTVLLNGKKLASFAQIQGDRMDTNGKVNHVKPHEGSFGFGTGKDQVVMFRNARVLSSMGQLLYASSLRDPHVLADFAVGNNHLPCILDGPKRDRAVWLGDNIVPSLALYYSTGFTEYVSGSIEANLGRQRKDGTIPAYSLIGYPVVERRPEEDVSPPYTILAGSFTMYVVRLCWDYLLYAGEVEHVRTVYPQLQKLVSLISDRVDSRGLVKLEGMWAMDSDYYNKPRSGATTKNNAVYAIALQRIALLADALGDPASAVEYRSSAAKVRDAVNANLYNAETGLYEASDNDRGIVSEDANAFALLAGFPETAEQRTRILEGMRVLNSPGGCLSFNKDSGYMEVPVVSPIMNGWHAEAALHTGESEHVDDALEIWRSCWGPMIDESSPYYSGCHWEFSNPEGKPHMEHFCSMAHPFSSMPVYSLSVHALGLAPTRPGWSEFVFSPHRGFLERLEYARGRVPTSGGGRIQASWKKESRCEWSVEVTVPVGCRGTLCWPRNEDGGLPKYDGKEDAVGRSVEGPASTTLRISYD